MALITVEKCKAYLGPAYTDATDDFLTMLIDDAQATVEDRKSTRLNSSH